jgi:hypothetical protein
LRKACTSSRRPGAGFASCGTDHGELTPTTYRV